MDWQLYRFLRLEYVVFAACLGSFVFWAAYWAVHVLAVVYGKAKLHKHHVMDLEKSSMPGVSIIKPLVGVDSNLASNLATFFHLKYHKYEILFCVHDEHDSALPVVRSLIEKHPQVQTAVFVGGCRVGLNPKVNNMMPAYLAAQYDFILVSDSGLRMKENALADMMCAMKSDVAVVTQLPFTCDRHGFAANLEKVYFGTAHARIYLFAHAIGVVCSTGMSSLLRKSVLDEAGGMQAFGRYIAEDYFFAANAKSRGWKCALSSQPALQNSGDCSVIAFQNRLSRWARLRIAMLPCTAFLEPFQECVVLGIIASLATNNLFEWNPVVFFGAHTLTWLLFDYVLLNIIQDSCLTCGKLDLLVAWFYRELTAPFVFLRAILNQDIHWRTATFRLNWGGVAEMFFVTELCDLLWHLTLQLPGCLFCASNVITVHTWIRRRVSTVQ
uniref:ceramide glucosyltransferase n=1 Tax=Trichuris muris TaxID=70415 RepID=A0A5S6QA17_TRIMR